MQVKYTELYKPIVLAMLVALFVISLIKPTLVKNYSMSPTLEENDLLIVNRLNNKNKLNKGDIIIFNTNIKTDEGEEILLIKRVVALPGDTVVIGNGKVYVNANVINEEYLKEPYTDGEVELIVPKEKVFVMGDNRAISLDSRDDSIGLIDYHQIIGRAKIRLYPFKKIGLVN